MSTIIAPPPVSNDPAPKSHRARLIIVAVIAAVIGSVFGIVAVASMSGGPAASRPAATQPAAPAATQPAAPATTQPAPPAVTRPAAHLTDSVAQIVRYVTGYKTVGGDTAMIVRVVGTPSDNGVTEYAILVVTYSDGTVWNATYTGHDAAGTCDIAPISQIS